MPLQLPERGAPPSNYYEYGSSIASTSTYASSPPIISSRDRLRRKSGGASNGMSNSVNGNNNHDTSMLSSSSSSSMKTRTARPPASPFIVSGKGKSASTPSSSFARYMQQQQHQHHQQTAGSNGSSIHHKQQLDEDEIKHINDTRRLEDMLAHNQSLLDNPTLCAILPGGITHVQARNNAMNERLHHLYSMREINIRMQDGVAINGSFSGDNDATHLTEASSGQSENHAYPVFVDDMEEEEGFTDQKLDAERLIKKEEEDGHSNGQCRVETLDNPSMKAEENEMKPPNGQSAVNSKDRINGRQHSGSSANGYRSHPHSPALLQQQQESFNWNQSHINGNSPPLSSSPTNMSNAGGFHRNWKANIANRTTMVGKVGQLSMDESLDLLQQRVNHKLRAQVELERATAEREERQASSLSQLGQSRRRNGPHAANIGDMQIANSAEGDALGGGGGGGQLEEEDDFDWHTAGYYHEDGEGS